MFRKPLTIISLIGLLLSVGLWGASHYDIGYRVFYPKRRTCSGVELTRGGINWIGGGPSGPLTNKPSDFELGWYANHFDFYPKWMLDYGNAGIRWLFVPLWIPTAVFAALSLWSGYVPLHRRRKREKLGLCLNCGYDLRGSQDICPECGTGFST